MKEFSRKAACVTGLTTLPLAVMLAGCGVPMPRPEAAALPERVTRKAIEGLYRAALVGTEEKPGCLWGDVYDTDKHIGTDPTLLPPNFMHANPKVDKALAYDGTSTKVEVYPAQNAPVLELTATVSGGTLVFEAADSSSADQLLTLGCHKTTSISLP